MVSKNQIKHIVSLTQKKFRKEHQLFIAEGEKTISELLQSKQKLSHFYYTQYDNFNIDESKKTKITNEELKKISALVTPNECLALFEILPEKTIEPNGIIVALDDIRDPGNLGTIIRLCDWFGISQIVCSQNCVDVYNPKVVQATMGSIARVAINYCNLKDFLTHTQLPIFGTFMHGENIYKTTFPKHAIVVLGNEANGISKEIENCISQKITIPRFGNLQKTESLNVATATAIVLSEIKRNS